MHSIFAKLKELDDIARLLLYVNERDYTDRLRSTSVITRSRTPRGYVAGGFRPGSPEVVKTLHALDSDLGGLIEDARAVLKEHYGRE